MKFARIIVCVLLFVAIARPQMQTTRGTITGTVVDVSGSAIPNAAITATNRDTGQIRTAETDSRGAFRFTALQVGSYDLRVVHEGFAPTTVGNVSLSVGQTVVERIEMKLAGVSEKLEVTDEAAALETAATSSSVALGSERVEEAPSQNRSFLNIVLTAPGVASSAGSNAQRSAVAMRNPNTDSGFSFGGMRGRNNSLSIDGVDNRDETTGGNRVAVGLEMVNEFRVSGTSYGAELGGAAGGAVNLVTRPGTNMWHGDVTYFTQNEFANARNPEAATDILPRFRRYQPGTSLNGPVQRDRTFFSTAIEQEWESGQEWSDAPLSLAGRTLPNGITPYRGLFDTKSSQTEYSFKANHQLGTKHNVSARYAFSRGRAVGDVQDTDDFTDRSARGSSRTIDHSTVGDWIFVINPATVSDFRAQYAERTNSVTPNSLAAMIEVPGVLTAGQSYRLSSQRLEQHAEAVESLHYARGRHQFSFGASIHRIWLDATLANRFAGVYIYPTVDRLFTNSPDFFFRAQGDPHTSIRTTPIGMWFEDSWQAAPGVTVELGIRYDHQIMPAIFAPTYKNVAPRIGIAWHPSNNSRYVFRAGFGIFYDRFPLAYLNEAIQKDGAHGYEEMEWPGVPAVRATYAPASTFPTTYSRKFSVGAERSFGKDATATIEFSSVEGRNLPRIRNIQPVFQLEQTAESSFNGVSISFNKRLTKEWALLLSYTRSAAYDDASDYDEQPMDPRNPQLDWALSRQHQKNRFAASAVFNLFENLTLAPIFTTGSGRPLNALETTDVYRTGAYPLTARPFGLPRNPFFMPGTTSLDARLMYTIPIHDRRAVFQFGSESFNILNHTNPLRVSPYFAAGGVRLGSYGREVETLNARQIQFFAQFEF